MIDIIKKYEISSLDFTSLQLMVFFLKLFKTSEIHTIAKPYTCRKCFGLA